MSSKLQRRSGPSSTAAIALGCELASIGGRGGPIARDARSVATGADAPFRARLRGPGFCAYAERHLVDYRWDDIRLFLALYRERTLAAAGVRLRVDGSTISRRLASFEDAVGHTLFERTRDGLVPTAAASELLGLAEEIERAAQRFAEHADAIDGEVAGVVRLTAPPLVAETFVVPHLAELLARHPALRLEIDVSQRRLDLARGEADLALRDSAQAAGEVVVTRLLAVEFAILAAPALAEKLGVLARLDAVPWITWGPPVEHLASAAWLAEHAPGVAPVLRSSSLGAQLEAAELGLGAVLVPRIFVRSRALVPLALGPALREASRSWPTDELWMAASRSRRAVPRVAAVWSFLLEKAGEIAA